MLLYNYYNDKDIFINIIKTGYCIQDKCNRFCMFFYPHICQPGVDIKTKKEIAIKNFRQKYSGYITLKDEEEIQELIFDHML